MSKKIKGVFSHNHFAEYNGKSIVGGHFGLLSRWLKEVESHKKISDLKTLIKEFEKKNLKEKL